MTKVLLLKQLKKFSEEATRDLLLPVKMGRKSETQPPPRAAAVYLMRLPEMRAATEKAPYMIHQLLTGKDVQQPGQPPDPTAVVRTVFCVYHEDEQEGGIALLNLMEQLRISLLERVWIGEQFRLDLKTGIESLVYPDNADRPTTPYYLGEMITVWHLPPVTRLDAARVIHGLPPWDPHPMHLEETTKPKGSD